MSKYTDKVKKYLSGMEDIGDASLQVYLELIGKDGKTFHYDLDAEGTSWGKLKMNERKARCASYALENPRCSLSDLAESCGYNEASHISIKFKGWFFFSWTDYKARPSKFRVSTLRKAAY